MIRPRKSTVTLAGIALAGVVFLITFLNRESLWAAAKERYSALQLFTKVLNLVQQYYVEEVDTEKLIYGGIKGMLKELDPHTNFLPPEIFKEFESETSGEFGGLGIEITVQNGVLTVISPIEDTPAWQAGIKSGDKVVGINGNSTKGMSLVEAAKEMRGKEGDIVRLTIFREGFDKPQDIEVKRGIVKIRSVKFTDLSDGYGYARITSFIENTHDDLVKQLDSFEKKSKDIRGLIIDLRGNPGGLLNQAVKISDLFLDKGVIVTTIGRNQKEKEILYAKAGGTRNNFPIVILMNEYSASASEILAGALQDNKRALIMGSRSFGKGSVQSVVRLNDGSGLKLTVALYYTPSGRSIQAEGIVPDIALDNIDPVAYEKAIIKASTQREKDIAGHLLSDTEKKATKPQKKEETSTFWWVSSSDTEKLSAAKELLKKDFQILQAYNYLRAWKMMEDYNNRDQSAQALSSSSSKEEIKK